MENEMTVSENKTGVPALTFTPEQVELIKRTVCKGATDDEFALFLYTATRLGLNPLAHQIHAVKRYDSASGREVMAIQTGIDGYRLNADRTGKYAPGREPSFVYEGKNVVSATAYVKKLVGGTWHEVAATAHMSEYAAKKKDGTMTNMWATKPHIMLAKCAEALALRRAFPAELSGLYTDDEMQQADSARDVTPPPKVEKLELPEDEDIDEKQRKAVLSILKPKVKEKQEYPDAQEPEDSAPFEHVPADEEEKLEKPKFISAAQGKRLYAIWKSAGKTDDEVKVHLKEKYGIQSTRDIPCLHYNEICEWAASK